MPNWYTVARPHEDIRKGDFDEAVFAAKLGDVVTGDAPQSYSDPYAFYKKTYLTKGLENLLGSVSKKLTRGRGPGVVQLKTPFGGGKTHALILVYHYLTSGERVAELLPEDTAHVSANVSAIVGTDVNPSEGFREGTPTRHTFWGEIAYQLGGEEAYSRIANNDRDQVSPGRKDLRSMLEPLQPFVILLDEMLQYIVRARAVEVSDSTLGAQTLSFLQELTEAVSDIDNGLLIATLPSSEQEDFGESEQANLAKMEKIFGRLEAIYTPVEGEEVYSIIRRRLFEQPDKEQLRSVVDDYIRLYQSKKGDLPAKATTGDFRKKMELAYPFHPEVIDLLIEKWSTFTSFQRTRGALRLLARVVEDLYQRERPIDLILPGDINLGRSAIRQEFLSHIGNEYEGVISSDIAGDSAKSRTLDEENRAWDHLAERNATAIFLHSFSADQEERGIGLPYVKLDVARPDMELTLVTDVLQKQMQELWYLNTRGDQEYYFSNVPNLNRMVIDKKGQVQDAQVRRALKTQIENELGDRLRAHLWPSSRDALPDNQELKLAVLDPDERYDERSLSRWVEKKGQTYRNYKNTIIFARPDDDRHARFIDTLKEYIALQEILNEIESGDRSALEAKKSDVQSRIDRLADDFPRKVRELYHRALVPVNNGNLEEIDFGQPPVGHENLDTWYHRSLASQRHGKILNRPPSARFIQSKFLSQGEFILIRSILEQFYKDTAHPALDDPDLIAEAIANGVENGSFGLALKQEDELVPDSVHFSQPITASQVNFHEEGWALVTAEKARQLVEEARPEGEPEPSSQPEEREGSSVTTTKEKPDPYSDGTATEEPSSKEEAQTLNRLHLRASGIPSGKLVDLQRGVLKPITSEVGEFELTIEFDVEGAEGIPEDTVEQIVMETLQQLGATVEKKETE